MGGGGKGRRPPALRAIRRRRCRLVLVAASGWKEGEEGEREDAPAPLRRVGSGCPVPPSRPCAASPAPQHCALAPTRQKGVATAALRPGHRGGPPAPPPCPRLGRWGEREGEEEERGRGRRCAVAALAFASGETEEEREDRELCVHAVVFFWRLKGEGGDIFG